DDRRARTRRSGDECERLRNADLERVGPAHVVDLIDPRLARIAALALFHPEDDDRANDERRCDRRRREQLRLDCAAEGEPEDRGGQKRDEKVEDESLRAAVAEDAGGDREELRPVFPADGEYRAGLDDDLEELRLFAGV